MGMCLQRLTELKLDLFKAMDKVYTPATIPDQPFPTIDSQQSMATNQSVNQVQQTYSPVETQDQVFPAARIADDLISNDFSTKTLRILNPFQFTPSGAIKIGDFKQGVNGEIDISPAGIVALDVNGDTTVAVDGETGNLTLKGTLRGQSLIAGTVNVGNGNIQIDGPNRRILFFDQNGIPSIVIGNV